MVLKYPAPRQPSASESTLPETPGRITNPSTGNNNAASFGSHQAIRDFLRGSHHFPILQKNFRAVSLSKSSVFVNLYSQICKLLNKIRVTGVMNRLFYIFTNNGGELLVAGLLRVCPCFREDIKFSIWKKQKLDLMISIARAGRSANSQTVLRKWPRLRQIILPSVLVCSKQNFDLYEEVNSSVEIVNPEAEEFRAHRESLHR